MGAEDKRAYFLELSTGPESETQWAHLVAEMAALALGKGVAKIEGDQTTQAVFFFEHPTLVGCDREVAFTCIDGEWRAEG